MDFRPLNIPEAAIQSQITESKAGGPSANLQITQFILHFAVQDFLKSRMRTRTS